ncbi:MAG: hypothetical protein FE78DRAFT_67138 [Acidomyces sp. 'richmondensis']|nr:MAG: hypothetical protein FE78DRAFT_67138 [Acidomyces sp. 'richmondensis']
MALKHLPLTIIVAATPHNGIGRQGSLPWPMLKKEMAYFARVTKRVPTLTNSGLPPSDAWKQTNLEGRRQNVVIMGRKTWESIPPKFRPLKDRINVVISSQQREALGDVPSEVVVQPDILSGLAKVEQLVKAGEVFPVGRVYVIGGARIYKAALELPQTKSILMTRIHTDYPCDTFFPCALDTFNSGWQRKSREDLARYVGEDIPLEPLTENDGENEISYEFRLHVSA